MDYARETAKFVETRVTDARSEGSIEGRGAPNVRVLGQGSGGRDMCVLEAISYIAGEPRSDQPACACPVIAAFLRNWNDDLSPDARRAILLPLMNSIIDSRAPPLEEHRGLLIGDWLIRTQAAAWLRLARSERAADALERLPAITSMAMAVTALPAVRAAARIALKVRNDAWVTPFDAATASERTLLSRQASPAPWAVAMEDSANTAAAVSKVAVSAAALDAARGAIWAVPSLRGFADLWNAAHDTARLAAHAGAGVKADELGSTRDALQDSAVALIKRMVEPS